MAEGERREYDVERFEQEKTRYANDRWLKECQKNIEFDRDDRNQRVKS